MMQRRVNETVRWLQSLSYVCFFFFFFIKTKRERSTLYLIILVMVITKETEYKKYENQL